jgi:hypothetical protein
MSGRLAMCGSPALSLEATMSESLITIIDVTFGGVKLKLPTWTSTGLVPLKCNANGRNVQRGETYGRKPDIALQHLASGEAKIATVAYDALGDDMVRLLDDLPNLAKNLAAAAAAEAAKAAEAASTLLDPPAEGAGEQGDGPTRVVRNRRGR